METTSDPPSASAKGSAPLSTDPLLGSVVGDRYRLLARIGEGGMSAVYRADHVYMRKTVAVKLLHPELSQMDEIAKRFTREAEACSRMAHPNIVQVTDFGRMSNGRLFLVMELIPGDSLAVPLVRKERIALERALDIGQQILRALDHAHGLGIVHRDLKPENVMLVPQPDRRDLVKLLDFGIAKVSNPSRSQPNLTQAGDVFGTPEYMSPEQAMGEPASPRSDLYACGLLLYQMIAGERPFDAPDPVEVLKMQILQDVRPLRAVAPDPLRPTSIDAAIERALQKDPANRFASAAEMAAALSFAPAPPRASTTKDVSPAIALRSTQRTFERALRLLRVAWTTRWLPRLQHLWVTASTRFRRLSRRDRTVVVSAAAVAVAVVLVVAAIFLSHGEPSAPSTARANVTATEADLVRSIEEEMRQGRTTAARTSLSSALAGNPRSARLQLLLGSVEFLELRAEAGLLSYRAALRLDPSLGADPALLANTAAAARDGELGELALRILEDAGAPACPTLAELASTERGQSRRAARKACRRLACDSSCGTAREPYRAPSRTGASQGQSRSMFAR
jgi:serine/threonine-protein kinase